MKQNTRKPLAAKKGGKFTNTQEHASYLARRRDRQDEEAPTGKRTRPHHAAPKGGKGFPRRPENPFAATRGEPREDREKRDDKPRFAGKSSYGPSKFRGKRPEKKTAEASPFTKKAARPPKRQTQPQPAKHPRQGILLWGVHAVREAWLNPQRVCHHAWVTAAGRAALEDAFASFPESGVTRPTPQILEREELDRMLPPSSVHQGVVLDVAPLPEVDLHDILQRELLPDLIIVLDQVTDPHNVGAILRSAAAFGAGAIVMTERNAPVTTGVMAKTASGAAEHVPQIHVVNLARALTDLREAGYWCVGLAEQGERDLESLDLTARTALVLGSEGDGLRRLTRENCDELARLPTGGAIGSLNVSNAAAVGLYEVRRQKRRFKTTPAA